MTSNNGLLYYSTAMLKGVTAVKKRTRELPLTSECLSGASGSSLPGLQDKPKEEDHDMNRNIFGEP